MPMPGYVSLTFYPLEGLVMPFFAVSLMIQIALVAHAMKTGRDRLWIWVLILAPVVGCVAYALIELLPELLGARRVRALEDKAKKALNPSGELRAAEAALDMTDTIDNRLRYARALIAQGKDAEALTVLTQAAAGPHGEDPKLLLDIAEAAFNLGEAERCLDALNRARAADPEVANSSSRHLLYARALEAAGRINEARSEYRSLVGYFPGEEARCRYAELLARQGDADGARALYQEILSREGRAKRDYRRDQQPWIAEARRQLQAR
jgi:hypothetical protein